MKKRIALLVSLCVLISAGAAFGASGGAKVGFVDLQQVQAKSRWGDMIRQEVKKEKDRVQSQMEPKLKAIKEKGEEFEKKRAVLDEKARTKQQQELQNMQQDAQKLFQDAQAHMSKMQEQYIPPFSQKIKEVAQQIARKDNYDMIVNKDMVLFGTDKDDLTSRVISELDKVTPSTLPSVP